MKPIRHTPGDLPRRYAFTDCHLDDLWTKDGRIYRTIGFITDPAIIIEDVLSGQHETHVIHSPNFNAYRHYKDA